jgi:probable phosphoglycerate mutase
MTRIVLVRHCSTDAVGAYHAGRAPGVHLNSNGRLELQRLVDAFRAVPLAAVVSSPLERTRETADPIAASHGLQPAIDDRLVEFDVGDWTGRTFASLEGDALWRRFNAARSITRAPGGELMLDVQRRAVDAVLAWHQTIGSGNVAVVSHGDVIRAVLQYFLGVPLDFVHRLEAGAARISIVEVADDGARVLQVNGDTATLLL